jgi:hypothetical protein
MHEAKCPLEDRRHLQPPKSAIVQRAIEQMPRHRTRVIGEIVVHM